MSREGKHEQCSNRKSVNAWIAIEDDKPDFYYQFEFCEAVGDRQIIGNSQNMNWYEDRGHVSFAAVTVSGLE
jgi:hypothetical protein